ncbi:uncharacterized protein B4U80_07542 [Leptotrombidium deliense]|uniref:TIR domain-containing protein n=1 Tax=Leptotrombidium deliense TaxID=299467 RepID=A0A443SLV5_9ACAR|nr:uncharacterized protein B4U80_07542 [Leptotrombidium deliense]
MDKYVKRVAKLIADQTKWTPEIHPEPLVPTKPKPAILDKKPLIVISAHPQQRHIVNEIKFSLDINFDVWCTIDELNEFGSLESLTSYSNNLPTIPEGSESSLSESYKAIARQIVQSKRPVSLPAADATSESRRLTRMVSQLSTISQISSLTPDKMDKLKQFETKVTDARVVIVLASESYFRSRTSRQHVYYCEHRKNMILVRCDKCSLPSWFSMLMADELPLSVSDTNYLESIKSRIKRVLDPSSKANDKEMQESKVAYLVNYMKKNLPVLDTCVYVLGSTKSLDSRTEEICKAIGVELAKLKNVTLVTNGFNGTSDIVARAFFEAKEKEEFVGNRKSEFQSSVVHILPLKDSQMITNKCRQNPDGSFEPVSYGQTLFLGESLKEREKAVARILNTCILIGGGTEDAYEAQEFIWNDHYVIPVISSGGAASGQFGVPFKIFESPVGVQEEDRKNLIDKEASSEEVAKSVVKIIITVKKCIASYKTEVNNSNKSTKKSMKKKKPQEKLDVASANAVACESQQTDNSPDKVLPVVDIDVNAARSVKHYGKWKKVQRLITFSRHC